MQNLNAAIPINYVVPLVVSAKDEGQRLARITEADLRSVSAAGSKSPSVPPQTGTIADLEGTYTGRWASEDPRYGGTIAVTIKFVGGQPSAFAVMTGSPFIKQEALVVNFVSMGAGVWRMNYRGKKAKISGSGIFQGDTFVGDYRFSKMFVINDSGEWRMRKAN